jgi:hypothetical protein
MSEPKTRKDFEGLLRTNGYPQRLIKWLSSRKCPHCNGAIEFPIVGAEAEEQEAEILASLRDLTSKIKTLAP